MIEKLRGLFCLKINVELEEFKDRILNKSPEEIYNSAYIIDCMINLKETLQEKCSTFELRQLRLMVRLPSILDFVYDEWLDYEDSRMEELDDFISRTIKELEMRDKVA